MLNPWPRAPLLATACLAAILAVEITDGGDAASPNGSAVATAPPHQGASDRRASSPAIASASLPAAASAILSRPLFAHDRRPLSEDAPLAEAAEPPVKLVGTIVSDQVRIAFLEFGSNRMARVLGDRVGNARIVGIDAMQIALQSGDGQIAQVGLSSGTFIDPTPPPPHLEPSHLAFHMEK